MLRATKVVGNVFVIFFLITVFSLSLSVYSKDCSNSDLKTQIKCLTEEVKRVSSELNKLNSNSNASTTDVVIGVHYASNLGPIDTTNNGFVDGRLLVMQKRRDDTALRIGYTDNLRVVGANKACRWEILLDGKPCPSGALVYDRHDGNNSNVHDSAQVVGYCSGIMKGVRHVQVRVSDNPNTNFQNSNCETGWMESRWVLETIELNAYANDAD